MRTYLVTGGAGFIGSNYIHYMFKKYDNEIRIINVDALTYAGNLENLKDIENRENYTFVKADICDKEAISKIFAENDIDRVVHFAAESHVDRSVVDPESFVRTNVMGTTTLLDACRTYGIKRYHQVSTDEVYGDLPLDRPDLFFTEETPIHTSSPYSSSKAGADLLVLAYHRTYGLPVTISRCSNNYGPYHFPEKLIPLMIANALNEGDSLVWSHLPKRDDEIGMALVSGVTRGRLGWQFMLEVFIVTLPFYVIGLVGGAFAANPIGSALASGHATPVTSGLIWTMVWYGLGSILILAILAALRLAFFSTNKLFAADGDWGTVSETNKTTTTTDDAEAQA